MKKSNAVRATVAVLAILPSLVLAEEAAGPLQWTSARPDGHAPIGIMGDHTHGGGEWMLSYRYMFMEMDGNRDGTDSVSLQQVYDSGFMVAPKRMTMEMHMLGMMYAPTDRLTLMGMIPYSHLSMDLRTMGGQSFTTESDGLGDVRLMGLYLLRSWNRQRIHLNAGLGLPSGSIDERDDTPAGPNQKLPYPMQLGSGTVDLLPGITYLGESDDWSWGGQLQGTIHVGRNNEGYTLGDRVALSAWGARRWCRWMSTSLRLEGQSWGDIDGRDSELNPAMVPTADPSLRGGEEANVYIGANFYGRSGRIKGQRLALEWGMPVYQSLDGPQLETDWRLMAGWQYAW